MLTDPPPGMVLAEVNFGPGVALDIVADEVELVGELAADLVPQLARRSESSKPDASRMLLALAVRIFLSDIYISPKLYPDRRRET